MPWMPGAVVKEIKKHRRALSRVRGVCLHVAVSEAQSLYGFFSGALVASHFYVRKDGTIEQYVNTSYQAPANLYGNSSLISVETQGGVRDAQGEPWTDAQLRSLAAIAQWAARTHGVPLGVMPNSKSSSVGIGYHRQGVDPYRVSGGEKWSNAYGKICPGNAKIAQVDDVVRMAGGAAVVVNDGGTGGGTTSKTWVQKGDKGSLVKELQNLLNKQGFNLDADGIFGPATEAAVRQFQASRGLVIDGIAGAATFGALRAGAPVQPVPAPSGGPYLRKGHIGDAVRALQQKLNARFPSYSNLVVDGIFGDATEAVVREFQRRSNIAVDGIAGKDTLGLLGLTVNSTPTPAPEPSPVPAYAPLEVDGILGRNTIARLQQVLGTPIDGSISKPSTMVRALQTYLNNKINARLEVDGLGLYHDGKTRTQTHLALQRYLGTLQDGVLSKPSSGAVAELQRRLNANTF